jgi:hypothetical protein
MVRGERSEQTEIADGGPQNRLARSMMRAPAGQSAKSAARTPATPGSTHAGPALAISIESLCRSQAQEVSLSTSVPPRPWGGQCAPGGRN